MHGFIFTCSKETFPECMLKKVFGLPVGRMQEVANISPCTPLFLYNISTKELVCGFEAAGYGKRGVIPGAFKGRYPAQVPIKLTRRLTVPLPLAQYKDIVTFEETPRGRTMKSSLDKEQVGKLLGVMERESGNAQGKKGANARTERASALGIRARSVVNERENVSVPTPVQDPGVGLKLGSGSDDPSSDRRKKQKTVDSESPGAVSHEPTEIVEKNEMQQIASNGHTSEPDLKPAAGSKSLGSAVECEGNEQNRAVEVLGDKVDDGVLSHWAWGGESRTTVALHPLPPPSELDVKSLVNVLDMFCKNRYRFLFVNNHSGIGRVLHVDFLSTADVIKFHLGVSGKSWKELNQGHVNVTDPIIMHFWSKSQGLNKLKEMYTDKLYLHVGDPCYCPKLQDDIPFFFMLEINQDASATAAVSRRNAPDGVENECTTAELDGPQLPSTTDAADCDLPVKCYDFSGLYKRMGHLEHARQKCEEELRCSVQKDIVVLKDIKKLLRLRYDSAYLQPQQGSSLFQNMNRIIETEMDTDLLDMNGAEIDNDVVDSDLDIVG